MLYAPRWLVNLAFSQQIRTIKRFIVHHSLTEDGEVVDTYSILKFHTSWRYKNDIVTSEKAQKLIAEGVQGVVKPWIDIGYHYLIESIARHWYAIVGRSLALPGAHTVGHNYDSIGVCFVGNYDKRTPSMTMLELAAKRVFVPCMRMFDLTENDIYGHRNYTNLKTCPGKKFDLDVLKDVVRKEAAK